MARIMITDDAAFMRMMVRGTVEAGGHEVVAEAQNGKEAVELYEKHLPDLVTMDITMPEMDGIEAVRAIIARFPDAKILMCSAMGQQASVVEAIKAGAKGFLVKPFQKEKILEEIGKIL